MKFLFYICYCQIKIVIDLIIRLLTNKIPHKKIWLYILQANLILSFLSNSFTSKVKVFKYFINRHKYKHFLSVFVFNEKNFVQLTKWIYPTFYNLKKIDDALKKGNGVIVLNVHSFNHFALQILLQKKYSNISTIVMDNNAHLFFNNTKANMYNKFYRYDDKNLFFKLRKELNENKIIIIHQDLINLGTRRIEVDFMKTKIHILENIAAYLSFYSSCEIISSYTISCGGIFTKVKFENFNVNKYNTENIKQYVEIFHKCTAKYIESFVRKFPHQWMGWQYFRPRNLVIEPVEKAFFPDFVFFDIKIGQWLFCNLYPLHLIKVKSSKVFLYFYQLGINGIKSCYKKSGSYN